MMKTMRFSAAAIAVTACGLAGFGASAVLSQPSGANPEQRPPAATDSTTRPTSPGDVAGQVLRVRRAITEAEIEARQAVVEGAARQLRFVRELHETERAEPRAVSDAERELAMAKAAMAIEEARLNMLDAKSGGDRAALREARLQLAQRKVDEATVSVEAAAREVSLLRSLSDIGRADDQELDNAEIRLAIARAELKKAKLRTELVRLGTEGCDVKGLGE